MPEETKPREKFGFSPHSGSKYASLEPDQTQNRLNLGTVKVKGIKLEFFWYNGDWTQVEGNMLVKIETYFDGEFWCGRGIGEDIFTQGETLDDLYRNIQEAVSVHYGEIAEPITILTLSEVKLVNAQTSTN